MASPFSPSPRDGKLGMDDVVNVVLEAGPYACQAKPAQESLAIQLHAKEVERQIGAHRAHVVDDLENFDHPVSTAQAADAYAEVGGLPARRDDITQRVDPVGNVDGRAKVVFDSLPLQDGAPTPGGISNLDGR
jgi:hypothetical protein